MQSGTCAHAGKRTRIWSPLQKKVFTDTVTADLAVRGRLRALRLQKKKEQLAAAEERANKAAEDEEVDLSSDLDNDERAQPKSVAPPINFKTSETKKAIVDKPQLTEDQTKKLLEQYVFLFRVCLAVTDVCFCACTVRFLWKRRLL